MRLLERPGPGVYIIKVVVLPFECERSRLGPGAQNQVMRLVKPFVRFRRICPRGVVFGADTSHEACNQTPTGDVIEHGVFFRYRQRIIQKGQGATEDRQLRPFGPPRKRARGNAGGGHQAVGILVVFVDANPVETEVVGVLEFVKVAVVERVPFGRIVVAIGQSDPGGVVFFRVIQIEIGVRHQMDAEKLHCGTPSMK